MTVDIDEGKTFRKIILYVSASKLARGDAHIPLLHPDDREESRKVWSTCLRTGEAGEVSFRVRDAQGGYRWFLSRAEPLRASDGTLLQWVGVNLDIEELMCAEQALRESEAFQQSHIAEITHPAKRRIVLAFNVEALLDPGPSSNWKAY